MIWIHTWFISFIYNDNKFYKTIEQIQSKRMRYEKVNISGITCHNCLVSRF